MKRIALFITGILLSCTLLCSCGFHYRGHVSLPAQLQSVYIESHDPYDAFIKELRHTLKAAHVTVTDTEEKALLTLDIVRDTYHVRLMTIGGSNQTREYLLTYSVTYQLKDSEGQVLTPAQTVSVTRNHISNANQLLGNNNEEAQLKHEMIKEVIYKLLLRLSSPQTAKLLV